MTDRAPKGVLILGGAHGSLALARSLGALGVPVWLVSSDTPLPGWSRFVRRKLVWSGPGDPDAVPFLLDIAARHDLAGFVLVAAGDAEVQLVSQAAEVLSAVYRVMLPDWERLQHVCEKPLLYRRAAELCLDIPPTYAFASLQEAEAGELRFPVVMKPNMGGGNSHLAKVKVIRADDRPAFLAAYRQAVGEIGIGNVVVQELIPGGGESQYSYAALWCDGEPVAEFTARRARQYPVDFGYTSTYVETVDEPAAIEAARLLLRSIGHHGLVEVEFKRDPRDGALRILDVNPRPWSWFALAAGAGVDLGGMLWDVANGRQCTRQAKAEEGAAWMYLVRDTVSAFTSISRGRLRWSDYLASFRKVRAWAVFAPRDPVPGGMDIPLTVWRVLTRRVFCMR